MPTLQVTLSNEQAIEYVRSKVESGEFSSEADVIQEGLSVLQREDHELEGWLHEVGAPTYDRIKADPSRALSPEQVLLHLEERRRQRAKTA